MRKHLLIGLIGLLTLGANTAQAEIVAVRENGHVVYVDVPSASASPSNVVPSSVAGPQYGPRKAYLYYSKSEHRWKRVASASGTTMRKARSAAADVQQYIQWRAQQPAFRVNYGDAVGAGRASTKAAKPADGAAEKPAAAENPASEAAAVATSVPARASVTNEQLDAIIDEAAAKHGV